MRLSLKTLIWLWVFLFLLMGGLVFNAYTKLKPDTFTAVLTEQVQRNYPGTKLDVGQFHYRLSMDFNLSLQNVVLRRNQKIIGTLREIELRVPWWLLVFGKGKAQINLTDLNIFIDSLKASEGSGPVTSSSEQQVKVILPEYLADAQYTLRAENISIKDVDGQRRFFHVSKLLVREFQYGKNSAFEVKLPISMEHGTAKYESELWLFGDVTPSDASWLLNFRGEFRTQSAENRSRFEDLILQGRTKFRPQKLDVNSDVTLSIEKNEIGAGTFVVTEDDYQVKFNFSALPLEFLALFEEEIKNPYLPKLDGEAEGTVILSKNFNQKSIRLKSRLSHQGQFFLGEKNHLEGKWLFTIDDNRWDSSFITPQGEMSYFRRSMVNLNQGGVTQFTEEMGFTGVDLGIALSAGQSIHELEKRPEGEHFTTKLTLKQCIWNDKTLDAEIRYGASPDLKFYQAALDSENRKWRLNYQQMGVKRKFYSEFDNFPWSGQFNFLDPFFHIKSGVLHGKVEGQWQEDWESGQWLIKLSGKSLQEPKGEVFKLIQKVWETFQVDWAAVPEQIWNLSLRQKKLKIDSFMLEGMDPAKLNGQIDTQLGQKSFLVLTHPKNKSWKPVRKEFTGTFFEKETK